jgi:S-adenosylhomocysteine hydrolase
MKKAGYSGHISGLPRTHDLNIESGIDIHGHLRVLRALAEETKNEDDTHCVILQHIIPTTIEYIDRVNSVYPVDLIIAIVYSVDETTVDQLRAKGYTVYVPIDIDDMLNNSWKLVVEILERSSHPLMIQEVGGYFSDWTAELGKYKHFKGCVEDTNNGLWRYQSSEPLGVPVISMADSPLKQVEDALIGDACVYSLEKVMRTQMASILQGLRVGVVGWGRIGKACAGAFSGRAAIVSVYDINPIVNMLAYAEGYYPMPLKEMLNEVDVVMGCSGRRSIRTADLHDIKDRSILCSASSKDIEFDLKGFSESCDIEDLTEETQRLESRCAIRKYTVRKTGKRFYVLKRGTPIDFLDMPLQGAILDCTCSELFVCMRELATNPHDPGIISLTDDLQIRVAQEWLRIHSDTFTDESVRQDKTFLYPESWHWT